MGGARAPAAPVAGAALAARDRPELRFLLFGPEPALKAECAKHKSLQGRYEIIPVEAAVPDDARPAWALRRGGGTSMQLAIQAVAEGRAGAVVSGGNTGALMAMSRRSLSAMAGVRRPAIASVWPSRRAPIVVLDVGATLQCTPDDLVSFAIMGAAFAQAALGREAPSSALLNIGEEEVKGHEELREAAKILAVSSFLPGPFLGFMEPHDMLDGKADVVVTDGFTGNIALKTAEGVAQFLREALREALTKGGPAARLGAVLVRPALARVMGRYDPRRHNGAVFLGLDGIAVKSHGRMDGEGFARAVATAADMLAFDFLDHVSAAVAAKAAGASGGAAGAEGAGSPKAQAGKEASTGAGAAQAGGAS